MLSQKTIKIFLASSVELKDDRDNFEIAIRRKNEIWRRENKPYLDLQIWETMSEIMSETRSQDEYNHKIKDADIFILLVWTKAGKFSIEEFEIAKKLFVLIGKPKIIVYQKNSGQIEDNLHFFLEQFHADKEEYFHGIYEDFSELQVKFYHELDSYFLEHYPPSKTQSKIKEHISLRLLKIIIKSFLITYFASVIFDYSYGASHIWDFKEKDFIVSSFSNGLFFTYILYIVLSIASYRVIYYIILVVTRLLGSIASFRISKITKDNIIKIEREGLKKDYFNQTFSVILQSPIVSFNNVLQHLEKKSEQIRTQEQISNTLCDFATMALFIIIVSFFKQTQYLNQYILSSLFIIFIITAFFISVSGIMNLISLEYLEAVVKNHKKSIDKQNE